MNGLSFIHQTEVWFKIVNFFIAIIILHILFVLCNALSTPVRLKRTR